MGDEKEPSQELLAARRVLEGMPDVLLLKDWTWNANVSRWILYCQLSPDISPDGPVPSTTDWFVLVDPAYPWGSIKFYPAKTQGLVLTFPHQNYNGEGNETVPWRDGALCLDTNVRALGRQGYDTEPYEVNKRLQWHFQRALDWLSLASRGELVLPGEPFELPEFPLTAADFTGVAFSENNDTFSTWQDIPEQAGLVKLLPLPRNFKFLVVKSLASISGRAIITPSWGQALASIKSKPLVGIWLRLNSTPVLHPWQVPATWGELRQVCHSQGVKIDDLLKATVRFIRDGEKHVALLGFPIPDRVGNPPCQMHWQAIQLPVLSHGAKTVKGFRPNEQGYWRRDRTDILRDEKFLNWLGSENWHVEQITTRGSFTQRLRSKRVLMIGAGAVGSVIAELLVRAGVQNLMITDGDRLEVGNLVRQTLTLNELGMNKAEAIAQRLRLASPYAAVDAFTTNFPPDERLKELWFQHADIILDCTGSDEILHHLALFSWNEKKLFISLSLGFQARRLYCFVACGSTFPQVRFREMLNPWLKQELKMYEGQEFPREGIGCWHPIFPARADDIWMMASIGAKQIEFLVVTPPIQPELIVFEQQFDENGTFIGVHKLCPETIHV